MITKNIPPSVQNASASLGVEKPIVKSIYVLVKVKTGPVQAPRQINLAVDLLKNSVHPVTAINPPPKIGTFVPNDGLGNPVVNVETFDGTPLRISISKFPAYLIHYKPYEAIALARAQYELAQSKLPPEQNMD